MTPLPCKEPTDTAALLDEIIAALDRGRRYLILTHEEPDLDGVGAQLALNEVLRARGKQVSLWSPSPIPGQYGFMPGIEHVSTDYPAGVGFDVAVALDTAALSRLGDAPPLTAADVPVLVNIDHHESNECFGTLNWVNPAASSVGEMLYGLFERWGVTLSREIAVCLYASIVTDTGGFSFSNTTPRALQVAAALVEHGADPFTLWQQISGAFSLRRHLLLGRALGTLRLWRNDTVATMRLTQEMLGETHAQMDETEHFVQYPRTLRGVHVAALFREQPDRRRVRVSLRSNVPAVHVGQIAARFGGGGHASAAGCTLEGPLDDVERTVVAAIGEVLEAAQ